MIERGRFRLEYIDRRTTQRTVVKGLTNRCSVKNSASGRVDQKGTALHGCQCTSINQMCGSTGQGYMQRHHVGLSKERIEIALGCREVRGDIANVAEKDLGVEGPMENAAKTRSDAAQPYDAEGALTDLLSYMGASSFKEAVVSYHGARFNNEAFESEVQPECELGNRIARSCRTIHDCDIAMMRCFQVDVLQACTSAADHPQARRCVHQSRVDPRVTSNN